MMAKSFYRPQNTISNINFQYVNQIHFIGIGGSGMSGIAKILVKLGYRVTGSDLVSNEMIMQLIELGAIIFFDHHAKNVCGANIVVISSAIKSDNPEIIEAKKKNILIFHRSEMLSALMRLKYGIAVSGTHGKSTTTAIIVSICLESGFDPTFVNGGVIKSLGTCANFGSGRYFIVEADESDASFLYLYPSLAVITNIEEDHMGTYLGSFENLKKTFLIFLHNLPVWGKAVLCLDDSVIRTLLPKINRNVITYGFCEDADLRIVEYTQKVNKSSFILCRKNKSSLQITMNIPGRHNALNAAAAIAVAIECGVEDNNILQAMFRFRGVNRRFEYLGRHNFQFLNGRLGEITIVNDYGHHPSELNATIETIRVGWPNKRLVMAFQPHRFTRIRDLYDDFVKVLSKVDVLLMFDVYPAGEVLIPGSDSVSLCETIRRYGKISPILVSERMFFCVLSWILRNDDFLVIQGAGAIGNIAYKLVSNK